MTLGSRLLRPYRSNARTRTCCGTGRHSTAVGLAGTRGRAERQGLAALTADNQALHEALMGTSGSVTEQKALQAAAAVGLDVDRLRQDEADPAIAAAIARNQALAAELGINGTPGFVIGQEIVPGAVDRGTLEGLIAKARETQRAQP